MTDSISHFPPEIEALPPYVGRFDAFQLNASDCEVLMATYPAGSEIEAHSHDTDNAGVITMGALYLDIDGVETRYGVGEWYRVAAGITHSARFEEDSAEIEFWFTPGAYTG